MLRRTIKDHKVKQSIFKKKQIRIAKEVNNLGENTDMIIASAVIEMNPSEPHNAKQRSAHVDYKYKRAFG